MNTKRIEDLERAIIELEEHFNVLYDKLNYLVGDNQSRIKALGSQVDGVYARIIAGEIINGIRISFDDLEARIKKLEDKNVKT